MFFSNSVGISICKARVHGSLPECGTMGPRCRWVWKRRKMPGLNGAPFEAIAGQLGPGLGAQDSKKPGALAQFRKKNPQTKRAKCHHEVLKPLNLYLLAFDVELLQPWLATAPVWKWISWSIKWATKRNASISVWFWIPTMCIWIIRWNCGYHDPEKERINQPECHFCGSNGYGSLMDPKHGLPILNMITVPTPLSFLLNGLQKDNHHSLKRTPSHIM